LRSPDGLGKHFGWVVDENGEQQVFLLFIIYGSFWNPMSAEKYADVKKVAFYLTPFLSFSLLFIYSLINDTASR
jgi:hypothetical protein